jgi:hypothetical protein
VAGSSIGRSGSAFRIRRARLAARCQAALPPIGASTFNSVELEICFMQSVSALPLRRFLFECFASLASFCQLLRYIVCVPELERNRLV